MDDLAGKSMQLEDVVLVQLGHSLRSHRDTGVLRLMPGHGLDSLDGTCKLIGWTQVMPL